MHDIANWLKPHGPRLASAHGYVSGQRTTAVVWTVGSCLPRTLAWARQRIEVPQQVIYLENTYEKIHSWGVLIVTTTISTSRPACSARIYVAGGIAMVGSKEIKVEAPDSAQVLYMLSLLACAIGHYRELMCSRQTVEFRMR